MYFVRTILINYALYIGSLACPHPYLRCNYFAFN